MKNMHTGVWALRVKDFENIYYFTQKIYSRIFFVRTALKQFNYM